MDSLWTYLPVYLAGGLFIVGIVYERPHPGTERARRLMSIDLLRVHMEDHELDIFEPEHGREVHLVEVGADDYLGFPEDLAAKLIAAA